MMWKETNNKTLKYRYPVDTNGDYKDFEYANIETRDKEVTSVTFNVAYSDNITLHAKYLYMAVELVKTLMEEGYVLAWKPPEYVENAKDSH